MTSKTFNYTKAYQVSSSIIEGAYFNENDNSVVLDVSNTLYRYSGVTESDVATLVYGGDDGSVGGYYNSSFKKEFGPADKLGYWYDLVAKRVEVDKAQTTPTTPKGLFTTDDTVVISNETKEYSLNSEPTEHTEPSEGVSDEPTKEFSLNLDAVDSSDEDEVKITVHFTLDEYDKKFKFVANSDDPYAAVDELRAHVNSFGATGKVSKVVIKFV